MYYVYFEVTPNTQMLYFRLRFLAAVHSRQYHFLLGLGGSVNPAHPR
jgi:hypothetical protein